MAHEMTITPSTAANFSEAVYGVRTNTEVEFGFNQRHRGHGLAADWNLGAAHSVAGTSGTLTPTRSGFAAIVPGTSNRPQETVVAVRGTQTGVDWQSNLAISATFSATGGLVHKGFHNVYTSIADGVLARLAALPASQRGTIHVTGHSLGGAVASLMAARIRREALGSVKLYTYGAPRPGTGDFTSGLESLIGKPNIYRVYNFEDIVPMVPLYPYIHPPADDIGIRVGNSTANISPVAGHVMPTAYIPRVKERSWETLIERAPAIHNMRRVDYWLNRAAEATRIPGAGFGLRAIGWALQSLIDLAGGIVGVTVFAAATAVDMIAMLISKAWAIQQSISSRVLSLVRSILAWTGRSVIAPAATLTSTFLRYVLDLVYRPIASMIRRALDASERNA